MHIRLMTMTDVRLMMMTDIRLMTDDAMTDVSLMTIDDSDYGIRLTMVIAV